MRFIFIIGMKTYALGLTVRGYNNGRVIKLPELYPFMTEIMIISLVAFIFGPLIEYFILLMILHGTKYYIKIDLHVL